MAKVLGDLLTASFRLVCNLGGYDPEGALPWSIAVTDASGTIVGILSGEQAEDVAEFLQSAEVVNLCQANFLSRLGMQEKYLTPDILEQIGDAFVKLSRGWCSNRDSDWSSLAGDIWAELERYLEQALPAQEIWAELDAVEAENFREYMIDFPGQKRASGGVPRFLRDLVNLSLDIERIGRIQNNVRDIQTYLAEYYQQMRIEHAQHDYRIQIEELYVDRDMLEWNGQRQIASSDIFSISYHPRIVVTGDPGVGKSTFTEYIIWTLCNQRGSRTPLIVNCREYAISQDISIVAFLRDRLAATVHLRFTEEEIEDLLTLGRGFLIIDGIDEVLDLSRRRQLIRTVETLGHRFPLCPIIATTRNIGYSQAQFKSISFRRYELRPFTEQQVETYVRRWFSLTQRAEAEVDRFLTELESAPDLRSNPLMLSLLCVLYRARGYIPRNRRQIYSQCADLLFNRWDRMRHIEQPYDHQHYGDELMQEIASWFYNSQAAQAGLEEQQIRKVIALFLKDTAAVPSGAAEKRAAAFLDFCADRAWLLGSAGTNERGQRLFVFTHRTFMEFFAAESLVRSGDTDRIVSEVAKNFDRDASSVLPDLIVQSAEVHRRGGARDIINGLINKGRTLGNKKSGKYLPLCLRIINLSPVNPSLIDYLFKLTFDWWAIKSPAETRDSMTAVLDMYRDPRSRFMDLLRSEFTVARTDMKKSLTDDPIPATSRFLIRWAHLYLSNDTALYQEEWSRFVNEAISKILTYLRYDRSDALKHFLIDNGFLVAEPVAVEDVVVQAFGTFVPGYAIRSVNRLTDGQLRDHDTDVVHKLAREVRSHPTIQIKIALKIDLASNGQPVYNSRRPHSAKDASASLRKDLQDVFLWLACVIHETRSSISHFSEICEEHFGIPIYRIFATRDYYIERSGRPRDNKKPENPWRKEKLSSEELKQVKQGLPLWLAGWCQAQRDIVLIEEDY